MVKLEITDDIQTAVIKMSGLNPGALNVLASLLTKTSIIDPDVLLGGLSYIHYLDVLEIYGSHIWELYGDICGKNFTKLIAVLRGWQMGFISKENIHNALAKNYIIDFGRLRENIEKELPKFKLW